MIAALAVQVAVLDQMEFKSKLGEGQLFISAPLGIFDPFHKASFHMC